MLKAVPESKLIDEDGAKGKAARVGQSFGGHLPMHIEDALELLVEVFDGMRAKFLKEASHGSSWVGALGGVTEGRHNGLVDRCTTGMQVRVIVVPVAQELADIRW